MENFEFLLKAIHNQVSKINDVVDNLNRGGCGIFAHALSKELIKIGIPAKVLTFSLWGSKIKNYNQDGIRCAKEIINRGFHWEPAYRAHDIGLAHLMVYVKNGENEYFIDSEDIYFGQDDYYNRSTWYARGLQINTLISSNDCGLISNDDNGNWNNAFDRKLIPFVYEFVKEKINLVIIDDKVNKCLMGYLKTKQNLELV